MKPFKEKSMYAGDISGCFQMTGAMISHYLMILGQAGHKTNS